MRQHVLEICSGVEVNTRWMLMIILAERLLMEGEHGGELAVVDGRLQGVHTSENRLYCEKV